MVINETCIVGIFSTDVHSSLTQVDHGVVQDVHCALGITSFLHEKVEP